MAAQETHNSRQVVLLLELLHPLAEDDSGLHDISHGDAVGAGRDHICNGVEFAGVLV